MKNIFSIITCSLAITVVPAIVFGQSKEGQSNDHIIKINLGSIAVKNVALQFEKSIGSRTSAALGVRFQPYGKLPFQSYIKDAVDDPDFQVGEMQIGNLAITPEFRYYTGKGGIKGFYLAPYLRYATYKMETPVTYASLLQEKTAFFRGNINSFSGGLLVGSQFNLSSHFVLDWWILGAHFGSSNGSLDFKASLTPMEQEDIRRTLDNADIPLFNIKYDINSSGGSITSKGAWAGFRGFALNLGYRF